MRPFVFFMVALTCISPLSATAQVRDTATLRFHPSSGTVIHYKTVTTVPDRNDVWTGTWDMAVDRVKPNGETVIGILRFSFVEAANGNENDVRQSKKNYKVISKLGSVIDMDVHSVEDGPLPKAGILWEQMAVPMFPEKNVVKGESWVVSVDNPAKSGEQYKVDGIFLGSVPFRGERVWRVRQRARAVADDQGDMMTFTGVFYLNPKDGTIIQAETSIRNVPYANGSHSSFDETTTIRDVP